jgi:polar amino acid transport system permease protein
MTVGEVAGQHGAPPPPPRPNGVASGRARRIRRQRLRWASYALSLTLIVVVGLAIDWAKIEDKFFNPTYIKKQFPDVITVGAKNTLLLTFFSFLGGLALGLAMALLRRSEVRAYRWLSAIYIEIFRGLPALLTIFLVGFILPTALDLRFPDIVGLSSAAVIALSLVYGAYIAETIRAGLEAVPRGQTEAARSLGMSSGRTMVSIVIPQAFRIIIPPLTNEMIALLKDTALVATLGTTIAGKELTKFGRDGVGDEFNGTPLVVAGLVYLVITIPLTRLVAQLEKRNRISR